MFVITENIMKRPVIPYPATCETYCWCDNTSSVQVCKTRKYGAQVSKFPSLLLGYVQTHSLTGSKVTNLYALFGTNGQNQSHRNNKIIETSVVVTDTEVSLQSIL
jgi:hypothetical protein